MILRMPYAAAIIRRVARLFLLVSAASAFAAIPVLSSSPAIPPEVQTTIRQRVDYGYCPGIVVGLLNTEGATYFGYGEVRRGTARPPDEHTLFEIGSVTKVFTTTLLADMAGRGELALDDTVQAHLPSSVRMPARNGIEITLAHLATHTSGLPSYPSTYVPASNRNPFAGITEADVYAFLNGFVLPRNPGSAWEYSNLGVGLLGIVLTRTLGVDYEEAIVARIADELGLVDTRIRPSAEQQDRFATGYSGVLEIPPFEMGALNGAGALRSTVADLLAFLAANRGWRETSLRSAMTEAQKFRKPTSAPGLDMGLGWLLRTLGNGRAITHDGATIGQRAFVGFLPNGSNAVVVLGNSNYDIIDIGLHILDSNYPLTTVRQPLGLAESLLRRYVGRYSRTQGDYFDFRLQAGHLVLQYSGDGDLAFTLYPATERQFYLAAVVQGDGTFVTNTLGRATAMVWRQSGQSARYDRTPVPVRLAIERDAGLPRLRLSGEGDREYRIEASADLKTWTAVSTNTVWSEVPGDISSSDASHRFYRAMEQGP